MNLETLELNSVRFDLVTVLFRLKKMKKKPQSFKEAFFLFFFFFDVHIYNGHILRTVLDGQRTILQRRG